MDAIDSDIIRALQENARISYRDLGALVGLSPNAAAERVRRLVEIGVIAGFTIRLNPEAADRRLHALIDVQLIRGVKPEEFEPKVAKFDTVVEVAHLTGRFDYQLRVSCGDAAELDATIRRLKTEAGVLITDTRIVLRTALARMPS
jgi:Lrp/AsnC family leucine-responsive transcriptional regulator